MPNPSQLSEKEREQAMFRFRIIEPLINRHSNYSKVSENHSISISTLKRWVKLYNDNGLCGLVKKKRSDKGVTKIDPFLIHSIEALHLHKSHFSIATIHRLIEQYSKSNGFQTPSYSFISKYISKMPKDIKTLAHNGTKTYENIYELLFLRESVRSNQIWQADHTMLDLLVIDQGIERRPWLTIIQDDMSRSIAGYFLTFDSPSSMNTSLALRQAIWRKDESDWPICGIPEVLYTDHGSDFTSRHIEQVCVDLKIQLIFSSVGKPRGRGKVERFFESINQMFLSSLPGYINSSTKDKDLLNIETLDALLKKFILKVYHQKTHPAINSNPIEYWQKDGFLPNLPESLESLDLLLITVVKSRKVRNIGIAFCNFIYCSPILASYIGETVFIRYDPRDISEIRVFYNDKYLCTAICSDLSEHSISLEQITKARKKRKAELSKKITWLCTRVLFHNLDSQYLRMRSTTLYL